MVTKKFAWKYPIRQINFTLTFWWPTKIITIIERYLVMASRYRLKCFQSVHKNSMETHNDKFILTTHSSTHPLIRLSMGTVIFLYGNFQINFLMRLAGMWKKHSAYIMAWEKSRRIFTTLWLGWWEGRIFDFLEYFSPSSRLHTH